MHGGELRPSITTSLLSAPRHRRNPVMRLRRMGRVGIAVSVGQAALATRRQWRLLPSEHRDRLQTLLRQSRGRPASLSAAERQELQDLLRELNLGEVLRDSATRISRRGVRWSRR